MSLPQKLLFIVVFMLFSTPMVLAQERTLTKTIPVVRNLILDHEETHQEPLYGKFNFELNIPQRSEIKKILNTDNYKKSIFHYSEFKRVLKKSDFILYLADNAGETVFDRILLEEMKNTYPQKKIYYVVKSEPIINDALLDDAYRVGINRFAYVMTNGSKAPGTIISLCSKEFKRIYKKADMIISKGQGNFESLSRSTKDIFFMFMVKCSVAVSYTHLTLPTKA